MASLFEDLARSTSRPGWRQRYTLPLSIAVHVVVLLALIVVPLMATNVLPSPSEAIAFVRVVSAPPPPPPPPAVTARSKPAPPLTTGPPIEAPSAITLEAPPASPAGLTAVAGVPGGVGVAAPGGVGIQLGGPPPAPAAPSAPLRPGGDIQPPVKTVDVQPAYPPIAIAARVEGTVVIDATIAPDGRVTETKVLHSVPLLDAAAVAAVRQWRFTPTRLNGIPISIVMTVTVTFTLK